MRLIRPGSCRHPAALGILAGTFNPPTIAHVALLEAAKRQVDDMLCVVPAALPHKEYFGATLEQRLDMLTGAIPDSSCAIATTPGGLFIDIARECRTRYGPETELFFVCGADAAERIVNWDYGDLSVDAMLREFRLLVAPRGEMYKPPGHLRDRIHALKLESGHQLISSTQVRDRIRQGEPWRHLVPTSIADQVNEIYS